MAIVFPVSPTLNDTFVVGSITYKWDGSKWIGLGVTPADRLVEGSNSLEINANNDLVWSGDSVLLGTATANVNDRLTIHDPGSAFMSIRSDVASDGNSQVLDFGVGTADRSSSNLTAIIAADIHSTSGGTLKSDLVFSTNGGDNIGDRLRITSDGNVGIGQADPQGDLHIGNISGNKNIVMHSANNGNARLRFREGGSLTSGFNEYSLGMQGNTNKMTFEMQGQGVVAEITSDGIAFPAGKGIDFGAAADTASGETVASSLLDDYEEGTFTPTVSIEEIGTLVTDKQYGRYIKVGNKVTVWCYVQLNGTPSGATTTRAWQHGGLPFTQRDIAGGYDTGGPLLYWTIASTAPLSGTAPYHLVARLFNNATGGRIRGTDSSANQSGQNLSLLLQDNTEYSYTFTYECA